MNRKRMAGLNKLSDFGQTSPPAVPPETPTPEPATPSLTADPEKLVTVNLKITRSQQQWLQTTSQQVRDNNLEPVPAQQRVFPRHLVGVAIALLEKQALDWSQVKSLEDLQRLLEL